MRHIARLAATSTAAVMLAVGAPAAFAAESIPPMPQGYPIDGLYQKCDPSSTPPDWHYGETGRHYMHDGNIQFKNNTDQDVDYTAKVETGTNHKIEANSKAALPSGWNTTAKTEIGLKESNGWSETETFGPIHLKPGESFKVEYGVVDKSFISMFTRCDDGYLKNDMSANVIRGHGPAERYAYAYIIHADGSVADQAMKIPARSGGANSRPSGGTYTAVSGPSLEQIADPKRDHPIQPNDDFYRDPSWPKPGDQCKTGDTRWYPLSIEGVEPTYRKPGYAIDFYNWSKGDYTFSPLTEFVVGAEYYGFIAGGPDANHLPKGWLESIGTVHRAYMPVATKLKSVDLKPGDRVSVEYGTTMERVNYKELHCGSDGTYSNVYTRDQSSAPVGFWAEATVTSQDGSTHKVDVTPDEWAHLPVPTQASI